MKELKYEMDVMKMNQFKKWILKSIPNNSILFQRLVSLYVLMSQILIHLFVLDLVVIIIQPKVKMYIAKIVCSNEIRNNNVCTSIKRLSLKMLIFLNFHKKVSCLKKFLNTILLI